MTLEEAIELRELLKELESIIREEEESDRALMKYYEEHAEEDGKKRVSARIEQYMTQRGQIMEVVDIIDGLKVSAK